MPRLFTEIRYAIVYVNMTQYARRTPGGMWRFMNDPSDATQFCTRQEADDALIDLIRLAYAEPRANLLEYIGGLLIVDEWTVGYDR